MSATVLFNELQTNDLDLRFQKKTSSTLRIPESMMEEFEDKIEKYENVDRYLRYLLRTFRLLNYSGMVPGARKVKTEYQIEGLGYMRVDFKVSNDLWIQLSALALFYGKSRCWLFTFLLSLDLAGFGEHIFNSFGGVPTLGGSVLFTGTFWQPQKNLYTRGMRIKHFDKGDTTKEKPPRPHFYLP
ncbi:MAG: DUF1564 family protein [Leptospiraceae bacterium]|nr:DUF1564 family protein [Leptospiraceae bacterium]